VDTRKMLDRKASALMVGLCMIWGLQQVVLKLAAADISPMMQIAIRSGLSAILVYPLIQRQKGTTLWSKQYLFPGMWVAFLFSAEFFLVAEALRYTSASHTVVLLYTAPIFVALGLHWKLPAERLSMLQWVGISIAFLGIVVTFLGREEVHSTATQAMISNTLFGDFLALLAGLLWALTTISLRLTQLSDAHPTQTLFYQLVGGCVLLLPLAFLMGQAEIYWTGLAIGSLIFHTIVVSFISFMLWFWLLRNYLANRLGVFSFLTPIFGMLFGVLFLNEQIELNFLFGAAMVMLGVMIVSLHHWIEKKLYSQVKTNEWSE
jgi:drug/metabolite transporter (DMT)-like permease